MITDEHIKEGLSLAYVTAVAHMAGMDIGHTKFDYGIDGTFEDVKRRDGGRRNSTGYKIDFQLKSTVNLSFNNDWVVYNLEAKNYNDLVEVDIGTPRILIVFYMPQDKQHWINLTDKELVMKHCAWWICLKGQPETKNKSTITIRIHKDNLFNANSLIDMMNRHKEGNFYAGI